MLNRLIEKMGGIAKVKYFLFSIIVSIFPMVMLDIPFWIMVMIVGSVYIMPVLMIVPLWIAGLIGAICGPQDVWAILYYIVFGIAAVWLIVRITDKGEKE